jgi:DNA-binding NtrC family response regulator
VSRVAIVDDEPRMGEVLALVLQRAGHRAKSFTDPHTFLSQIDGFDLVITDLRMPGIDGLGVLDAVKEQAPDVPVILLTAHATVATAVDALKRGAADYLRKPVDNAELRTVVARCLERGVLKAENRALRAQVGQERGLPAIVADSDGMQRVLDLARRAARGRSTVLITGESGTGKEVVARAIHVQSDRVAGPFEAVNCKAFGAGVVESELFGHEKGSFTGAARGRAGLFERADGGTLFLDEIGEVGPDFQGKLLRVLQEREVLRVGGDAARSVDVRVLAATNRDLRAEVEAGRFREDLYFRLAVIPIHIPPLRERRDDILPLVRSVVARLNREERRGLVGWTDAVEAWLMDHPWPGNVRELQNTLERGVVLARGDRIELEDLVLGGPAPGAKGAGGTLQEAMDAAGAERIKQALREAGGVRVDAARRLGVERTTLYRLMKRYGIDG